MGLPRSESLPTVVAAVTDSHLYWLSATLAAITMLAHLSAQQMYDAYLPLLAKSHWKTLAVAAARPIGIGGTPEEETEEEIIAGTGNGNVKGSKDGLAATGIGMGVGVGAGAGVGAGVGVGTEEEEEKGLSLNDRVSLVRQSVASELAFVAPLLGIVSVLIVTVIQLICIWTISDRQLSLRVCTAVGGIWSFVFGAIALSGIRYRRGFSFEFGDGSLRQAVVMLSKLGFHRSWLSFKMLWKHHPQLGNLMMGQLLSAITNGTLLASFTVYVQRELNANSWDIITILFVMAVVSLISCTLFTRVVVHLTPSTLKWAFVTLKAITPAWTMWMSLGFRKKYEMYVFVAIAAIFNPLMLPLLRAIFQQSLPQGYEASLFSLLGVCNISFTWIGSLVIAGSLTATGSMRMGILLLLSFLLAGIAFVVRFDADMAQEDMRKIDSNPELVDAEFGELRTGVVTPQSSMTLVESSPTRSKIQNSL